MTISFPPPPPPTLLSFWVKENRPPFAEAAAAAAFPTVPSAVGGSGAISLAVGQNSPVGVGKEGREREDSVWEKKRPE